MKQKFAKVSEIKAGDYIKVDGGFTCIKEGSKRKVCTNHKELCFRCSGGWHYLKAQITRNIYVGIYKE